TNVNIKLGDIVSTCEIQNSDYDLNTVLNTFVRPDIAAYDDLTFFSNIKYDLKTSSNYIITNKKLYKNISNEKITLISNNLDCDIAKISNLYYRTKTKEEILKLAKPTIGNNSCISENTVIENGAVIGNNMILDNFSTIGQNCIIGDNVSIGKNVSISNALIGDNVCLNDGTKIGQDGFGFTYDETYSPIKIFHIGRVIIQNGVSIGANCTLDKGSFNDTIIGENTYIDNLVHIAHNVVIGNNCIIAGQCGFAGSATIGNFVQIGGQTGVGGHIKISDYAKIAAKSGVIRDISEGETVMGYPAININKYLKNYKKTMM
ncbi:UDP-3-O-(3-hydroxymyristoyl)glucosamine N-acyltransferase, partial [Pelagibacteraceae bacterium]|nr:UDP-3-O-(3-hydroxymyristoyl)glucosamine N-acyltransferase [Pelagibacteraceae bacterium]